MSFEPQKDQIRKLSALSNYITKIISDNLKSSYWIEAEISGFKINNNGNAYLKLVEPNDKSNYPIQANAVIFSSDLLIIQNKLNSYNLELKNHISSAFYCKVNYDKAFGLQLIISNVSINQILGALQAKRIEVTNKLIEENIFEKNKKILLPYLIKRIALICSISSDGHQDFVTHIKNYDDKILVTEFNSLVQGDKASSNIRDNLKTIEDNIQNFDVVAIIRGGGATIDFNVFNDYELCKTICNFPLPVITGIGHTKDSSLIDEVANISMKNPTDVADFFIDRFIKRDTEFIELKNNFFVNLDKYFNENKLNLSVKSRQLAFKSLERISKYKQIINDSTYLLTNIKSKITEIIFDLKDKGNRMKYLSKSLLSEYYNIIKTSKDKFLYFTNTPIIYEKQKLNTKRHDAIRTFNSYLLQQKQLLNNTEALIKANDPIKILKFGYTISYQDNKIINDIDKINPKESIKIKFYSGEVETKIIKINNNENGRK